MRTKIMNLIVLTVLTAFSTQVSAEYFVAYSPPVDYYSPACTTCVAPAPCVQAKCYKYKKYKTVAVRKKKPVNRQRVTTYYVWPMNAGTLWVPKCGGDCVRWVSNYCGSSCDNFYVPPQYFVSYPPPNTMDMTTADF